MLMAGLASHASGLKAGFAKIKITPNEPMGFNGHGGRWGKTPEKPRRFINDLFIRSIVIQDENGRIIVLVNYDLCMIHLPLFMEIRKWAKEKYGLEPGSIILNATHSHNTPLWWKVEDPVQGRYFKHIEQETKHAIERAVTDLKAVKITFGIMKAPTFMANRAYYDARTKKYIFATYPNGSVDPDVPIFAFYRDNKLSSLFYSFGAHATSHMYEEKNKLTKGPWSKGGEILGSSDFPGFVADELHAIYGNDVIAAFFQGAAGDMSYYGTREMVYDKKSYRPWKFKKSMDGSEKIIAKRIVDFINSDNMKEVKKVKFKTAFGIFHIPYDCDAGQMPPLDYWRKLAAKAPVLSNSKIAYEKWYPLFYDQNGKFLGHPWLMSLIKVNDKIQIVSASGEVCHKLALAVKAAYPQMQTVFLGYCYSVGGYIVDDSLVGSGSYQEKTNHAMPYRKGSGKTGSPRYRKGINQVLLDAVAELRAKVR